MADIERPNRIRTPGAYFQNYCPRNGPDRVNGRNQFEASGLVAEQEHVSSVRKGTDMFKKAMAAAAVAASVVGVSAAAAPQALALGDDTGTTSTNSNTISESFGNAATSGAMSPQMSLVQGSLNKLCLGVPAKANAGSLVGLVPVAVQDVPVLSAPQNQQCTENSTQAKGDEPLSHVLDDVPVLSANGTGNG